MGHLADIRNISQNLGTFGSHTGHRADIVNIGQTFGTLGRNWGHWADMLDKTIHFSHAR
jgi:hypothetical protein